MMNIFYDENMPFATEFFGDLGTLSAFNGRTLTSEQVAEADVLLVRSITQVNEKLLENNKKLKFVGTATIGVDHIDQPYLQQRNIAFRSAAGCNAVSVAEYVLSALVVLSERYLFSLSDITVGIVGAGNTGSRLSEKLSALNIKHLLCDPLLAEQGKDQRDFVELEKALACDVISLHVPLTKMGKHATYHLIDEKKLNQLTDKQVLINACRGEVVDNQALLTMKKAGHGLRLVMDVWENEPNILTSLIEHCEIATAHIAGYSLEGKARGTEMLYQALCQHLGKAKKKQLSNFLPKVSLDYIALNHQLNENVFKQLSTMVYDVRRDDAIFRQTLTLSGFDAIRKNYPIRREFSSITLGLHSELSSDAPHQLGFTTIDRLKREDNGTKI